MEKRKTLKVSAVAMAVTAAFCAPTLAAAADTSVQLYGHLDLSVDDATKGIQQGGAGQNPAPTGKVGWQADISSNLSYLGVRGDHDIGGGMKMVFQMETQVDVSATPGPSPVSQVSKGNVDDKVLGALGSRNSFLGIAGSFGALKVGKTDAPYKLSTGRMDPFSATVGDYNSIMGNTGGDNRAEFDTRLSHAMWYESPKWSGASFSALWAPGQNRSSDNSINASGEPDCTGGGGGITKDGFPGPCGDGSFGDAYSVAGVYAKGPIYAIAAYELHRQANRSGDDPVNVGVGDEAATKVGVQYKVASNTTINAILERMTRKAPNASFNERQRNGSWLAVTQKLTGQDDVSVGWAHAAKTPGQPGGGDSGATTNPGSVDNASNMYSVGYKHHFDKQSNWYAVYARQANHAGGHYDLGASGHGITTDCKDAAGACFTGETLQAVSVGWMYSF